MIILENLQNIIEVMAETEVLIRAAANTALEMENFDLPSEVSILLVDDDQIRDINKAHRKLDKPTDVLSFPIADIFEGSIQSDEGDFNMEEGLLLLGDIIISLETAARQAEEYGHSFERELAFLTTHGMYHLLGYDHETREQEQVMFGKQENVLKSIGLERL